MWNVADLVRTVAAQGDRPVLVTMADDVPQALGGRELADRVRRLARGLQLAGVKPGDTLILAGPNSLPWVVVRLAASLIGAVPAACDDQSSPADIAAIVKDSRARIAFASAAHLPAVRDAASVGSALYLLEDERGEVGSWRDLLADEPLADDLPPPAADAPAMIVYTSGTTGAPKSFVLTHGNIAANLEALLAERVITEHDRVLLPLPLHHVFPLLIGLLTTLASGATLVFPAAATGPQIAAALKLAQVTVIVGVPRLYAALLGGIEARVAARGGVARRLFQTLLALSVALRRRGLRVGRRLFDGLHRQVGPVRLMVSGGAKLEAPIIWKLEGLGWEVLSGYGLAETASMFTGNLPGRKRIGSEGRPLGPGSIRIAEPDSEGTGEIQLRGANVFAGYRDNPEANRAAFSSDGWFRTGDLGSLDRDGFLFVTGRLKEQIVLGGGKKVMPEELERHYGASPYIQEVALLERDGKLVAIVLPDVAAVHAAGLTRPDDAVRIALGEGGQSLPAYERVAGFVLAREPLPRTRLGKYQRFRLPQLYDAIQRGEVRQKPKVLSPEDQALIAASPAREVWELLAARYDTKGISLDSNLALDLGLDSLEWMTVAIEIEARVKVRLTEDMLADAPTVRDLLAVITDAAAHPQGEAKTSTQNALAADLDKWLQPTGPGMLLLGLLLYSLNWLLMRGVFRLRANGVAHIPADGTFVLVANHVSDLDPPVLAASMSWHRLRRLYWSGDVNRLFTNGVQRVLARAMHIFPVDERSPASTLGNAKAVLDRGAALCWFPESWRSPTGELQRFLPGIGLILADRPVTVVPAYIKGAFEALPRTRHWPRLHPILVTFGKPIPASRIQALAREPDGAARIVSLLHDEVAALERSVQATISKTPALD